MRYTEPLAALRVVNWGTRVVISCGVEPIEHGRCRDARGVAGGLGASGRVCAPAIDETDRAPKEPPQTAVFNDGN